MEVVPVEQSELNRRMRVRLSDGAAVEAVVYRDHTLCISSQVGCAVACPFCASGRNGLLRPLQFEELVGQVEGVEALGLEIQRVTLSGVGEPLHNHAAVEAFVRWCRERRLPPSFTTSGGPVARLSESLRWPHNGITISVHAGTEQARARAVPKGPSLDSLFACLAEDVPQLSRSRQRKVALAYLLVAGLNDSDAELDAFALRVAPLPVRTHLFAYNEVEGTSLRRVSPERYAAAFERLRDAGLNVRRSSVARVDPNGGCGTLVMEGNRALRQPGELFDT